MKPLKDWNILRRGYEFGVKTHYNDFHIGLDLMAHKGTPIYAPADGFVEKVEGAQSGKTAILYARDKVFRFLHLSTYGKQGDVKEGQVIGFVGSTGLSTGPHLHIDISRRSLQLNNPKNFIDL